MERCLHDDTANDRVRPFLLHVDEQRIVEQRCDVVERGTPHEDQLRATHSAQRLDTQSVCVGEQAIGSRIPLEAPQHGDVLPRSARVHVLAP
jgi:hypothetical protein